MDVLLLGTAASEGCPGLFCECERCLDYRRQGGRSLRLRQLALVNDDLLIDLGPDLFAAARLHGVPLTALTTALITHFHEDHWLAANLLYRHRWFREQELPPLHIYGGPRLTQEVAALCSLHRVSPEDLSLVLHAVKPFDDVTVGRYIVRALPATHNPAVDPLIYAIDDGSARLIYACDTGPLREDTLAGLAGFSAGALVLENTMGEEPAEMHMGRCDFLQTVAGLSENGGLVPGSRIVATHFSHHYHPSHERLAAELDALGVTAGYDGLRFSLQQEPPSRGGSAA